MPPGAAKVNVENDLDNVAVALGRDMTRIWYYFDLEDPAAKFRAMDEDAPRAERADVPAGKGPLTDDPQPGALPVEVVAYARKWVVALKDTVEPDQIYAYDDSTELTVVLRPVIGDPDSADKGIVDPVEEDLADPIEHVVHGGYRPCLTGFIREIEFMVKGEDKSHNTLFRGTYLTKILDMFSEELMNRPRRQVKTRFRSKALNPILQRQMRGLTDYESGAIRDAAGETAEKVATFYLMRDPLDQASRIEMLHNSMYIWPVRHSYVYLNKKVPYDGFNHTMRNTLTLYRDIKSNWIAGKLTRVERRILEKEGNERVYAELLESLDPPGSNEADADGDLAGGLDADADGDVAGGLDAAGGNDADAVDTGNGVDGIGGGNGGDGDGDGDGDGEGDGDGDVDGDAGGGR